MSDQPGTISITQAEFDALLNYSHSVPTGQTIGKQWKRRMEVAGDESWLMGEYIPDDDPKLIGIKWRLIEITSTPFPPESNS